ncbi:hypothetical protein P7C70_g4945, partial [Phenoliferia sp. Uapishka_3]
MEQLRLSIAVFNISPHDSPSPSPHPILALLPLISLLICLLSTLVPLLTNRLDYFRIDSEELLPPSSPPFEDAPPDEDIYKSAHLYLVRAGLVAFSVVTSAVLLSVSLASITREGEGGSWGIVFDAGVASVAVYLALAPLVGFFFKGVAKVVERQRIALSIALFVEVLVVNVLPLLYYNRNESDEGVTFGFLEAQPNPEQIATPISRHLFGFLDSGMTSYFLHPDAMPFALRVPPLPDVLSSNWVLSQFSWTLGRKTESATNSKAAGGAASFAWLHKAELSKIFLYSIVWLVGVFASPLSLNLLLSYVQDHKSTKFSPGVYVFGIFAGPIISSIAYQSALYRVSKLGIRIRVGLAAAVFDKVLRTKEGGEGLASDSGSDASGEKDQETTGSDTERSLELLGVPPKLIISLIGLHLLLGWSAYVALGTIIAFAPLSILVSSKYGGVQEEIMKATDRRMTIVGELVSAIRIIKMMSWERTSKAKISAARQAELDAIIHRAKVFAGLMILSTGVPATVALATFAAYVFGMKESLTAATAFTSLSLFGLLREAIMSSTYLLSAFMRARVSLDRIRSFIATTEELDDAPRQLASTDTITFDKAKFQWSQHAASKSNSFVLEIDKLQLPKGKTTIIAGDVGSGKSAFLYALLGEMHRTDGVVSFPKNSKTSYASQAPWLQDDSIRANILFGAAWDEDRYNKVVFQCALESDLSIMPEGDRTQVGEKGWWVGKWVNDPTRPGYYFAIYATIQVVAAISLTAMYLYLIAGAVRASRILHARLTNSIFGAPIRFFDTTAQGNIINRFSKDTEVVDTDIVESTQPVLDYSVQVAFVASTNFLNLPVIRMLGSRSESEFPNSHRLCNTSTLPHSRSHHCWALRMHREAVHKIRARGAKARRGRSLSSVQYSRKGTITIDGRNIEDTNLEALRSRVTLIPQDPTLFSGNIRSNLDPEDEHDDQDLWAALKRSQFVQGEGGAVTLDTEVASGGANFSQGHHDFGAGQRQLLSLARAIVRRSKILILDEATASLDNGTDELVQKVIREEFEGATNLTIAHRLESIMDFDRVIVLREGRVVEFDRPKVLLDRVDSDLRYMVEATGNWDKLYGMASQDRN